MEVRKEAEKIYRAAVAAVDPARLTEAAAGRVRSACETYGCRRILIIAFGKASIPMAGAALKSLGDLVASAVVIAPRDTAPPVADRRVRLFRGGHPLPDEGSVKGAAAALRAARGAGRETLVLCLVSGGGSALAAAAAAGITLAEKRETTRLLLESGADIVELNTVRKHLSRIKGGRLAEAAYPAPVVSLILSDVVGDPIEVIASGPTSPDPTTFAEALEVLARRGLDAVVPPSVLRLLRLGAAGETPETPKQGSRIFASVANVVIGNSPLALAAAAEEARRLGFRVQLSPEPVTGEAQEAGRLLARRAREERSKATGKFCLLSGGETVVTVTGSGSGGRNQELALAFALEAEGTERLLVLSAGTDGRDGPTDAAGAFADGETAAAARAAGLVPERFLAENDSATFFQTVRGSLVTGPTGTNVMDIQIVLGGW